MPEQATKLSAAETVLENPVVKFFNPAEHLVNRINGNYSGPIEENSYYKKLFKKFLEDGEPEDQARLSAKYHTYYSLIDDSRSGTRKLWDGFKKIIATALLPIIFVTGVGAPLAALKGLGFIDFLARPSTTDMINKLKEDKDFPRLMERSHQGKCLADVALKRDAQAVIDTGMFDHLSPEAAKLARGATEARSRYSEGLCLDQFSLRWYVLPDVYSEQRRELMNTLGPGEEVEPGWVAEARGELYRHNSMNSFTTGLVVGSMMHHHHHRPPFMYHSVPHFPRSGGGGGGGGDGLRAASNILGAILRH